MDLAIASGELWQRWRTTYGDKAIQAHDALALIFSPNQLRRGRQSLAVMLGQRLGRLAAEPVGLAGEHRLARAVARTYSNSNVEVQGWRLELADEDDVVGRWGVGVSKL